MRWKSGLFAASPGTMAFLMASARTSRRSFALRARSSGPWQVKHRSERIGRISRLKSTAGSRATAATGGNLAGAFASTTGCGAASSVDDPRSGATRASRTRAAPGLEVRLTNNLIDDLSVHVRESERATYRRWNGRPSQSFLNCDTMNQYSDAIQRFVMTLLAVDL